MLPSAVTSHPSGRRTGPCARPRLPFAPFLLAALIAAALLPAAPARADDAPRQLSVSGEAERRVAPDMALLRMAVVSDDIDATKARQDADATIGRALARLREAGVEDGDIDSSGLQLVPQYRWRDAPREQQLVGYRVTRRLEVRLLDLERLGELLVALSEAGINQLQAPEPGLADPEALYRETLAAAATNARERAELLAATLGESLGDVLSVSTHDPGYPMPMRREAVMMAADAAPSSGADSYQSGDISYRVSLTVTFELD